MDHIRTPKVENVKLVNKLNPKSSIMGKLYLTTSHLIFIQDNDGQETWILHMLINNIDKPLLTTSGSQLKISCSNFQTVTFTIQRDKDAHNVYLSLLELSTPSDLKQLFCFSYKPNKGELRQETGWKFHEIQAEFQRQGVPNSNWSTCTLNKDYALCSTYPKYLWVPSTASKELIDGSARFRSRGRLPVLTYLHSNGAAIIRCAQPLVGMSGVRSVHDEQYVECLRRANSVNPSLIHVVDTRPAVNAMANKAGGKGYESDKFYANINFNFKGIDNIHKMRASLKHLVSSVSTCSTVDLFRTELANSGWLKHVKTVLDVSLSIANRITEDKQSVIVHCSDGWDRTAQTCALASLMLDGYYRTLHGFQTLIAKEWLWFGHKFTDRCGHVQGDQQEISPTFIQFLDCVWQLTEMFPSMFQFNERYLVTIAEHVYSCQYGTFIGNCCKQREELDVKGTTYSLWGYLAVGVSQDDQFMNPLYDKTTHKRVVTFRGGGIVPQNVQFWRGLYCRFESGAHPRECMLDLLSITQNHTLSLEDHGRQLTKTIGYYTEKIGAAKLLRSITQPSASSAAGGGSIVEGVSTSSCRPEADYIVSNYEELAEEAINCDEDEKVEENGPVTNAAARNPVRHLDAAAGLSSELERIEKKFSNLRTSLVEKYQSST